MKEESLKLYFILGIVLGIIFIVFRLISIPTLPPPPEIPVVKTPNIIHYWFARDGETCFVFKSFFDSKERNDFHHQILNKYLGNQEFQYHSLYIVNCSQSPKKLESLGTIIITDKQQQVFPSVDLKPYLENIADSSKLYFNTFLKLDILLPNNPKQILFAWPSTVKLENAKNVELSLSEKKYSLQKVQCLRSDFYEFLESPKISFFPNSE